MADERDAGPPSDAQYGDTLRQGDLRREDQGAEVANSDAEVVDENGVTRKVFADQPVPPGLEDAKSAGSSSKSSSSGSKS